MAAAAIKIASAAQGDNAKKKKPSHSATHPEDEEKRAENDLKKIEEAMAKSRERRNEQLAEQLGLNPFQAEQERPLQGVSWHCQTEGVARKTQRDQRRGKTGFGRLPDH